MHNKNCLCRIAFLITIMAHMKEIVLFRYERFALMTIESHCNIVDRWCSMMARSLKTIFLGRLFHYYIATLTPKPVCLPRFMVADSATRAATCIIHECKNESSRVETKLQNTTHIDNDEKEHWTIAVSYKKWTHCDEKRDRCNAVALLDESSKRPGTRNLQ